MDKTVKETDSDRDLIRLCQEGDLKAFERLYRRYSRDVFTMALRMSGSSEIAEEVTQEVFISVYKNIHRFQFQSAFTTWLYRIVMRRSADYFRKNKKHQENTLSYGDLVNEEESPAEFKDTSSTPYLEAVDREREKIIEESILSLNKKQRSVLLLRYVNHLAYEEIATVLRCQIGTVKSRLNRAHKALENLIKNRLR